MAQAPKADGGDQSLYYFQLRDLFDDTELTRILSQHQWEALYPDLIRRWKSPDKLIRDRTLFPEAIIYAIARECTCVGDFFGDPDGETLHIVVRGRRPFRFWKDDDGKMVVQEIADAKALTVKEAIAEYGIDAVWLAQEYGKSRRGERDNRFRDMTGKE